MTLDLAAYYVIFAGNQTEKTMKRYMLIPLLTTAVLSLLSCTSSTTKDQTFEHLSAEYIEEYLRMFPERATSLGDHRYDNRLNDRSAAGYQAALEFNKRYLEALQKIDPEHLGKVNRVDYFILHHRIERAIFNLEVLKEHEWNPRIYNAGGAIYNLVARDFAPLKERLLNVKERLLEIPDMLVDARVNLKNPTRIHTETAILQSRGTITLIRNQLDEFIEQVPVLKAEIDPAREKAVSTLEDYIAWLENDLLPDATGDFRLGEEKFRKKLRFTLESNISMEEILERAERHLVATQDAMFETALPLYQRYNPGVAVGDSREEKKKVIKYVLDKLAESHQTNETIVAKAKECLQETRDFVISHDLVTVPDDPINIIVMPEFQRGVSTAYCDSPGPLEPDQKTFYAISPTPEDWPEERVFSAFREDNDYMLHDLTIHEAMPGHYLQLAHANRFKAPTLVRAIFSSGPFVEGWATYAEQTMVEHGYGGPEVKMQQLKMHLRVITNAIIDQKIHTAGMTETEAMRLMMEEGFQEEGEAAGKWRRACLTSTQLSTYYVGNLEMNNIRRSYEAKHGGDFDFKTFHDTVLSFGSPPLKYVRELMGL